jgi:putative ABC transport system permease protein
MDLKFALRSMRNTPGFTLLALLVMALGIGANTAVFSVVNTVLLKPLAYRDADRIVTIRNFWKKSGSIGSSLSGPDFHDFHDQSNVFDAMSYYDASALAPVLTGSTAEYAQVAQVAPEFFDVFAVRPLLGREFDANEYKAGSGGVVVISAAYWQSHFDGNPSAIGKTVRLNQYDLTVVGVMPPGFDYPQKTAIWYPANTIDPETTSRSAHNYRAVGRLKAGVTVEQAQTQMTAIAARLEQLYPPSNTGKGVVIDRMQDAMVHNVRFTLYLLLGAVGVVLLIACANMANLLLAKSTSRTREMAIRAAVGAGRGRIIRQLIVESAVLALGAGTAGLVLAVWGAEAIKKLAPANIPRLAETGLDGSVLGFTLAVSVISSLIFGLAPALAASRIDLNESLKQGAAKSVIGGGARRLRAGLVVAEIALSVVLLTGAGLLMRSFDALSKVDLGFRPEKILVAEASVPGKGGAFAERPETQLRRSIPFGRDMIATLASLPGVSSAAGTWQLPGKPGSDGGYWIDHPPALDPSVTAPQAVFSVISPGFLETLRIPLKAGRDFNDRDLYDAPFTVIINEALARKSFPGENPLGHVMFCGFDSWPPKGMTIVGIAGEEHQAGPEKPAQPEILMPYTQHPRATNNFNLLARTSGDPSALMEAVRRKIHERDPEVPVKFTTMEATVAEGVAAPRFRMVLLGLFAGLAVCLAMAGVYGVMSYTVGQRSSEIGLRMALGASTRDVLRLVLGEGLMLAGIGVAIGLAAAVAASRLLASLLFEVKPTDPATYLAVAAVLGVVALAACYVPAWRAARVDPLVALRQE